MPYIKFDSKEESLRFKEVYSEYRKTAPVATMKVPSISDFFSEPKKESTGSEISYLLIPDDSNHGTIWFVVDNFYKALSDAEVKFVDIPNEDVSSGLVDRLRKSCPNLGY